MFQLDNPAYGKLQPSSGGSAATLGDKTITSNGEYDPTNDGLDGYSKVNVNVPVSTIEEEKSVTITENGNHKITPSTDYDAIKEVNVNVNVPEKQLGTKTITTNGTYKATDDNLDGYSQVEVETSGVDINEYMSDEISKSYWTELPLWITTVLQLKSPLKFEGTDLINLFKWFYGKKTPKLNVSNVISTRFMCAYCDNLEEIELFDTSKVTDMSSMFIYCSSLITIPQFDTSNVTNMDSMFSSCSSLITVPQLNGTNLTNVRIMLNSCTKLQNFGGLLNLGQAYETTQSANYLYYRLYLNNSNALTHDSLMNVINGLYDIKTKGCNPQGLVLGSTNLAKLTSEEIAIATEKGWNVS